MTREGSEHVEQPRTPDDDFWARVTEELLALGVRLQEGKSMDEALKDLPMAAQATRIAEKVQEIAEKSKSPEATEGQ